MPIYLISFNRLFFLFVVYLLFGCGKGQQDNDRPQAAAFGGMQRAITVETAEVSRQSISRFVRSYGTLRTQDNVRVSPQVSERITHIHADLGDSVRVGQLLAKLRDATFKDQLQRDLAQLSQAKAAFRRDSLEFARASNLFERSLISEATFENSRVSIENSTASVRAAQASLTQTRETLGFTEIRSPINGVITRRGFSPGDLVGSGSVLYEINNLHGYEIRLFVPLSDRRLLSIGQPASIRLAGDQQPNATGVISRISPELDPVTGLAEAVVTLTTFPRDLIPGALAESAVTVQTNPNSIVIPRSAIVENVQTVLQPESNTIRIERSFYVFIAVGDSTAQKRSLITGLEQGDRIEILEGLTDGDKIIITGQGGLEDGAAIRIAGRGRQGNSTATRQVER